MEEQHHKLIASLKHLLAICNDGKEGYRNAAENVDAPDLKSLLTAYSLQRAEFASELKSALIQLAADPDNNEGGPIGLLHRAWIDIKTVFTANDNKAVLEACETGEKAAIEAYNEVLSDPGIVHPGIRQLLSTQRNGIQHSLNNIAEMETQYA
jgi:uncharacterized protein (TIGR02284 family)